MAVQPTTRSAFTSTIWNAPSKAKHSTNAAKFGGPNVNIFEGSKVQFRDGDTVWDVLRVFDDGTLFLRSTAAGSRVTRKIPPSDKAWGELLMVDGKQARRMEEEKKKASPRGGPQRNIDVGDVVTLADSSVRWTVDSILRDGTIFIMTFNNDKLKNMKVGPRDRMWNSIYRVSV